MARYRIPAGETRVEQVVVNSRFIASAAPASTIEEARAFIARIRSEFPDASHHVPVYRIGHGSSVVEHCSDAGEPSGTAGRPALAVLRGSELGDVVVVVTRYFGGTKLGAGGLVRAYGDAVREALAALPVTEKIPTCTVMLAFPYTFYERIRRLAGDHEGQVVDEDFAADVTLTVRFPLERVGRFQRDVADLTKGSIQAMPIE